MMSSEGWSARQSMYSPNWSPSTKFSVTSIGCPASVRRLASVLSRTASWSCSGIPSSMPITRMGIWAPRSAMKSKPPAPTRGSRERTQNSRILRLELGHPPGREDPGQQPPVHRVDGRVLEDEHAGWHLDVRPDQLDDPATAGDERLRVEEALLHVGEAGQRVEVVGLVVVERGLVPHPAVDRIGVGVDLDAVGVVVEIARALDRHVPPPGIFMSYSDMNFGRDQSAGGPGLRRTGRPAPRGAPGAAACRSR